MAEYTCPKCGKPLVRHESKKRPGYFFWTCSDRECDLFCGEDPENGGPFLKFCPECGKALSKWESKSGDGWYSVCSNETAHKDGKRLYFEGDGSPRKPREDLPQPAGNFSCPECGSPLKYYRQKRGMRAGQMAFACFEKEKHGDGKAKFWDDEDGRPKGF